MKVKDRKFLVTEHLLQAMCETIINVLEDENLRKKDIKIILAEVTKTTSQIMLSLDDFIESDEIDMVLSKSRFNTEDIINVVNMYTDEKIKIHTGAKEAVDEVKKEPTVIKVTKENLEDLPPEVISALKSLIGEK